MKRSQAISRYAWAAPRSSRKDSARWVRDGSSSSAPRAAQAPNRSTAPSASPPAPARIGRKPRRRLGEFKQRLFLQIAIADLAGRLDVAATMRAMSRLADECISAALECARLIVGRKAPAAAAFCVLGMGKLGAQELNLSSDIDLIYVFDGPDDDAEAVARLGETLTELLSAKCFRVDMRLRPGGRNAPLVTPFEGALSFYQSFGETWERAALLRARPVAGVLEVGRRLLGELSHFVYRRYLDFDTLRQLRAMKYQIERELRAPDLVAPQHQARLRRNSRAGIHRAGAHPGLWRTRSASAQRPDAGGARASRRARLPQPRPRPRTRGRLSLFARRRTQAAGCRRAARLTCCPPTTRAAVRWRRGWAAARMPRRGPVSRPNSTTIAQLVAAQFREMLGAAEDRGGRAASEARRARVARGAGSAPVRADAASAGLRAARGERGTSDAAGARPANTRSRRPRRAGASCSSASARCCSTRFASSPIPISR